MKTLKEYRIEKKMTQKQMAELLGIGQSTLSEYENLNKSPCKETALRIQLITGIPAFDLIFSKAKYRVFNGK